MQLFQKTLHLQSVPSFKVVKIFAGQPGKVGGLIRFKSEGDVATVLAAKRRYLSDISPISIERNRSRRQRGDRIGLRAGRRSSRSACTQQVPDSELAEEAVSDVGSGAGLQFPSSLNPHAPAYVPALMSRAPDASPDPPTFVGAPVEEVH